jgi:hypothetical protein
MPIYLGEFGAGDTADLASRIAWTRIVRQEAERRGIGWCAWDDSGKHEGFRPRHPAMGRRDPRRALEVTAAGARPSDPWPVALAGAAL